MMLTSNQLRACATCGQRIQDGDSIRIVQLGDVRKVGGAGLYKDALTLQNLRQETHHQKCYLDAQIKKHV